MVHYQSIKISVHAKSGTLLRANIVHKSIGMPMDYVGRRI